MRSEYSAEQVKRIIEDVFKEAKEGVKKIKVVYGE